MHKHDAGNTPMAGARVSESDAALAARRSYTWIILGLYAFLLVYGSLYPWHGWHEPIASPWRLMSEYSHHYSYADLLTNLLVYMPLGLLLTMVARWRGLQALVLAALIGGGLSLSMEYLQAYDPGRVPSFMDLYLNTAGAACGGLLAQTLRDDTRLGRYVHLLRHRFFLPGPVVNLGLIALCLWVLAQLSPLVPSLDMSSLRAGIKPLVYTLSGRRPLHIDQLLVYLSAVTGLVLLMRSLLKPGRRQGLLLALFFLGILFLKVPIVSRQLSMEALLGVVGALLLASLLAHLAPRKQWYCAVVLILLAVMIDELRPEAGNALQAFNWIPLREQLNNVLLGLADILATSWPFLALAYLAHRLAPRIRTHAVVFIGLVLFALMFALEWRQQYIPGRSADITDALIALLSWSAAWLHPRLRALRKAPSTAPLDRAVTHDTFPAAPDTGPGTPPSPGKPSIRGLLLLAVALLILVGIAATLIFRSSGREQGLDETHWPRLPGAAEVPRASLPHFHYAHPRLPAPSREDILKLQRHNPRYLQQQRQQAQDGRGALYAIILSAYVQPGSEDLDLLFQRLMALKITWRGQLQTKPLAQAYDWLYAQWSPAQRHALLQRVIEAGQYEIHFIRQERLSPYNVYLYNSPLQALMAAAIAAYGDSPEAGPVMNFTADYWLKQVLPVWRQVMGRNGGWHEGGEYVGIGIGQAVYTLPALWRKATGEDVFTHNSGLRGFLDFLIYRQRPDGSNYRWGDGAFFHRTVPDRLALALEYHDAAAYSLGRPPRYQPTSWPWGPLPDPALYDPDAIQQLPLERFFDGIGMLVVRSDWTDKATYLTFKAGNNYWSHSHLDQGAFTLYKGGALAIDSGLYGPRYNSDHHMDYDYQSIAHNTLTVTDPNDTVPAPAHGKHPARYIANDGGQRRVGSGWGVYPAPLNRSEWQQEYALYHTATLERIYDKDGIVVAIADITPAYTNALSGTGSFTNRTRRVERFRRIFAYDRSNDAVLIFDDVIPTHPRFRTRWLLHTRFKPTLTANGFIAAVPGTGKPGETGGRLTAYVIRPRQPSINLIGGPGFEFWVDGKNYDAGGKVWQAVRTRKKDAQPGRWRVELESQSEEKELHFFVVLVPRLKGEQEKLSVTKDTDGQGVTLTGPIRTTHWHFNTAADAVQIDIHSNSGAVRHIDITAH